MIDKYFPLYIFVFIATFVITAITEKKLIPALSKSAKQPIYKDGPSWHLKKSGTPTMGGVAFLLASTVTILATAIFTLFFVSDKTASALIISLVYAISNALIGIIDDMKKLRKKENEGLTPRQKILLQLLSAIIFLALRSFLINGETSLSFSFGEIELGIAYYPLAIFLLLGIVNCANLTDGIDGLASSVAFAVGVSFFYISAALNVEASILSATLIGISVAFLIFNIHPAKIFMGDTGSLFLGALISSCAFTLNNPLLLIFVAGVYVIEGVSVVIQVLYFKLTHKRIFKMAPLHHHLEKCGFSENKICILAMIITFIFSIPAYIFYLP